MSTAELRLAEDERPASFDADATAKLLGLSEQQKKFCLARLRGATWTASAREAGYAGDDDQIRSAASRAAKSTKVRRFLELAALEGGGVADQDMDVVERRRVLSRVARGEDKGHAIRAVEVLTRIDTEEQRIADEKALSETPEIIIAEIAGISPLLAIFLAKRHELKWRPTADQLAEAGKDVPLVVQAYQNALNQSAQAQG